MKITKKRLYEITKEVYEKHNCLPTDPTELANLKEAAWASLCGRVDFDNEEEIYQLVENDVWEDKYGQFEPYVDISDELEGDALKEDTQRKIQKVKQWRNCKYMLIKNEITEHLENEFQEQYWYLDCGEWGYVIISIENDNWHSSVSNGCDIDLADLDELCEQSIRCLVDGVESNLQHLRQQQEKDIKELEKAQFLVETLPNIINNASQDIARLQELASKKTSNTKNQIIETLLR